VKTFAALFSEATGHRPHGYQTRIARDGLPAVVQAPTGAGKTVAARAPHGKDCLIDLKGTFADGQTMDAARVDVCSQRVLNLTE